MDSITKLAILACEQDRQALEDLGLKEHPLFPRDMWVAAVVAGTTDAGYEHWWRHHNAAAMREIEVPAKVPAKVARKVPQSVTKHVGISLEDFKKALSDES